MYLQEKKYNFFSQAFIPFHILHLLWVQVQSKATTKIIKDKKT